jgi:membrane protein required for colicin V production
MNSFDAAVFLIAAVAVVMGYRSGLLRSVATIIGYLCAMPLAIVMAPRLWQALGGQMSQVQYWLLLFGIFVVTGMLLSALLRLGVSGLVGPDVSLPDRLAGSALGAARIGLLAVLMVLIFDRIVPGNRQPPFLADSKLRPILSVAGKSGLRTLPPDVVVYIDRLKRERGI